MMIMTAERQDELIRLRREALEAMRIKAPNGALLDSGNSSGQLGTATSSARFKRDICTMDKASEIILGLRPVTFRYKPEFDPNGIAQFGLVAEEVEKVDPALVVRDADGKPYSVRYEAVNAMLLNEFLKDDCAIFLPEPRPSSP